MSYSSKFLGQWEILSTLMNGGTLVLRTSEWAATLAKVSSRSLINDACLILAGAYFDFDTVYTPEISKGGLP
jgi:hypothetical protein